MDFSPDGWKALGFVLSDSTHVDTDHAFALITRDEHNSVP